MGNLILWEKIWDIATCVQRFLSNEFFPGPKSIRLDLIIKLMLNPCDQTCQVRAFDWLNLVEPFYAIVWHWWSNFLRVKAYIASVSNLIIEIPQIEQDGRNCSA